jgi:hypothetical protein
VFLAIAALVTLPSGPVIANRVWRCHREVYDFALYQGKVIAATSGGALVREPGPLWVELGKGGPAPFRKIRSVRGTVEALDRAGDVFELRDGLWVATGARDSLGVGALPSVKVRFRGKDLISAWSDKSLRDPSGRGVVARSPTEGDYALITLGETLLAGTPSGIFEYTKGKWRSDALPSRIPTLRPQGIALHGSYVVIGGIEGIYLKDRKGWREAGREPVRQMLQVGSDVWILHGSGAVDKLELTKQLMVPDALNGAVKRPWTSSLSTFGGMVFLGGLEGWIEKGKTGFTEQYLPQLKSDVVMAGFGRNGVRWIGTQKAGLIRYGSGPARQWNPGNGLTDTWVTALLSTPEGLYVATAGAGLFLLNGDNLKPVSSPSRRPRHLALYKGQIVVGGMDGAWIGRPGSWRLLPTCGEETTAIVAGRSLIISTAGGVFFI